MQNLVSTDNETLLLYISYAIKVSSIFCRIKDMEQPPPKRFRKDDILTILSLPQSEKAIVAYELGKTERPSLIEIGNTISEKAATLEYLKNISLNEYITEQNPVVLGFLLGLAGFSENILCHLDGSDTTVLDINEDKKEYYCLLKTVESILNLTSFNTYWPLHLRESLQLYRFTGSYMALRILSAGAHTSYYGVKGWLENLTEKIETMGNGTIIIGFDNNQLLKKSYKICQPFKSSIVTVIVLFNVDNNGQTEFDSELKPSVWMNKDLSEKGKNVFCTQTNNKILKQHSLTIYATS